MSFENGEEPHTELELKHIIMRSGDPIGELAFVDRGRLFHVEANPNFSVPALDVWFWTDAR
jgi:hypothetical protein